MKLRYSQVEENTNGKWTGTTTTKLLPSTYAFISGRVPRLAETRYVMGAVDGGYVMGPEDGGTLMLMDCAWSVRGHQR